MDHEARERARRDHGTSLVLEAGAGTGKTTLLVDRIEALIRSGAVLLDQIAAVTFTENAATTMKLRLRERLERARGDPAAPAIERDRAEQALQVLERAQISTLHALCAAILGERPLECAVVPGFRVADEAEADLLFARAWEEWLADRLVGGDDVLLEALERGIPLEGEGPWGERGSLRGLARTLLEQRDLEPLVADAAVDAPAWRAEVLAQADAARALLPHVQDGDTLGARLGVLVDFAEASRVLEGPTLVAHLRRLAVIPRNFGHKPRWSSPESLEQARRVAAWTKEATERWTAAFGAVLHGRLVRGLQGVTTIYERMKRELGRLDYLDLLLKARDALRASESVRAHFRRRFRLVLIDEFQDTDPLQIEIAVLLASDDPDAGERPWWEVPIAPGRAFFVGDPKQSIYRFRRADLELYHRVEQELLEGRRELTQNFRSVPGILDWVNQMFARLFVRDEQGAQAAHVQLVAERDASPTRVPPVATFGGPADVEHVAEVRAVEAEAVAALARRIKDDAWEIVDPVTGEVRRARYDDVALLLPTRTSEFAARRCPFTSACGNLGER